MFRYGLTVAAVGNTLYAIGGVAWHVPASGVVEAYDVATNTWSSKASMITARYHKMCVAVSTVCR